MIGEDIIDAFSTLGPAGLLLGLTIIIVIDGVVFPMLPEVWMVVVFWAYPDSIPWSVAIVCVAAFSSLAGNFTLYTLVKRARIPHRVEKQMKRYLNFIVVKDERLLLLNRIAPIVPYTGAFIAVSTWDTRKCAFYIVVGGAAKAAFIVLLSWLSFDNLRAEIAPWVSLGVVAVVLAVSVAVSFLYRKRAGVVQRSQ